MGLEGYVDRLEILSQVIVGVLVLIWIQVFLRRSLTVGALEI